MSRHPSVESVARFLTEPNVNLPKHLYAIAVKTSLFTQEILDVIPEDSPELTDGLRNLLRAKDSFVRAAL